MNIDAWKNCLITVTRESLNPSNPSGVDEVGDPDMISSVVYANIPVRLVVKKGMLPFNAQGERVEDEQYLMVSTRYILQLSDYFSSTFDSITRRIIAGPKPARGPSMLTYYNRFDLIDYNG